MADDATSVGGIEADLSLNLDAWDKAIAKAKADVGELTGLDAIVKVTAAISQAEDDFATVDAAADRLNEKTATVKVKADTSGANEIAIAEAKIAAAVQASDVATARAQISEMRLQELRDKGAASASQMATAELALSVAIQKSDDAAVKASAAEDALAAAQAGATESAVDETVSIEALNSALEQHTERIIEVGEAQVLMAAGIGAAILALPSLSGAAVGAGGALGAMGISGAAAIYGITQQIKDGTVAGTEYSDGLARLKDELDKLGETGSNVMLTSFQKAEQDITGDFPVLNELVARFSGILGTSADNLLDGALTGAKELMPLLDQGGNDLERFTALLDSAAGSAEFRQFVAYAEEELPHVEAMLGSTVTAALNLLQGLAPVGDEIIDVVHVVTEGISDIPVPVLTATAGAVSTVGAAFLAWKAIYPILTQFKSGVDLLADSQLGLVTTTNPLRDAQDALATATAAVTDAEADASTSSADMAVLVARQEAATRALSAAEIEGADASVAFGSALDFATGPIGIAIAVAGALGMTLLGTSQATRNATAATSLYTDAIREDSGVLGENTRAQVAKSLSDAGAFAAANKLGISQKTLTDAVLGQSAALDTVNGKITQTSQLQGAMAYGGAVAAMKTDALKSAALQLRDVLNSQSGSIQESVRAYEDQKAALDDVTTASSAEAKTLGVSSDAYKTASDAAAAQVQQTRAATLAMQLEDDAAGLLNNALTILNGGALNVAQAQTGLASASNAATDALRSNGKVINGNSEAAVANQQALQQVVQAAQQMANAQATASSSTAAGVKSYRDAQTALEGQLKAQHQLTPTIQAYIEKIFDVNNLQVKPTVFEVDSTAATNAIAAYDAAIKALPVTHSTDMTVQRDAAEKAIAAMKVDLSKVPDDQKTTLEALIDKATANVSNLDVQYDNVPRQIISTANLDATAALASVDKLQAAVDAVLHPALQSMPIPVGIAARPHSHGGTITPDLVEHFARGGEVWGDQGTATSDSISTRLAVGEFVESAEATSYPGVMPLLKAIDKNPAKAMHDLSQRSGSSDPVTVNIINKSGVSLDDLIEVHIERAGRKRTVQLSAGLQQGTF